MKFLSKLNRNYIGLLAILLLLSTLFGFFSIQMLTQSEAKETLISKEVFIKKYIEETGNLPGFYPFIEVKQKPGKSDEKPVLKEIYLNDTSENEMEPYLEYSNVIEAKGNFYAIKIRQPLLETADLVIVLVLALFTILALAFVSLYLFNKHTTKKIWNDFENNLKTIEQFDFSEKTDLQLVKSDIEEFDRLNSVIKTLTDKLKSDYASLKEFTENASHELQTPLTTILLNLEEIIQSEIPADVFQKVVVSIQSLKRLSNLNQSLVLLAKIENQQFPSDKNANINALLKMKLEELEPLIELKKIRVELHFDEELQFQMNEQLAEILINNIISNAVNHNNQGGLISISTSRSKLKICNTGPMHSLTDKTIFNRFAKGNSKSFGLGLAIVKKICDTHQIHIHYNSEKMHCFELQINPEV